MAIEALAGRANTQLCFALFCYAVAGRRCRGNDANLPTYIGYNDAVWSAHVCTGNWKIRGRCVARGGNAFVLGIKMDDIGDQ